MKSILILTLLINSLFATPSDRSSLPQKAQDFITTHFPKTEVLKVKEEKDGTFEVQLETGHEVGFNKNGDWLEVDGDYIPLPKSVIDLLPINTQKYLARNYSRKVIVKVEKEVNGYEVELSNSVELLFDLEGNFLKED